MDFQAVLDDITAQIKPLLGKEGHVATYIPALARVSPLQFGMALRTCSGQEAASGDSATPFSIQSMSKVFSLTLAMHTLGDTLWARIGREPSGSPFNSLVQLETERGIPRNPFINAGAIAIADRLLSLGDAKYEILALLTSLCGEAVVIDPEVAQSEADTGFRNAALANFMKGFGTLDKVRAAVREGDPYAFLLLDWRMPGMDGDETVLRIRESIGEQDWPRVIMVSAYCEEECRERCKKLKIAGFMAKPISRSDLYDTLITLLNRERKNVKAHISEMNEPQVLPRIEGKVLLVEDNPINQEIAVELLEQRGVRVDIANNGAEALQAVKSKKYDLIFMDVQMPVMDGLEATKLIRGLSGCSEDRLPIVAMTAHAMQGDYEKSLASGMNDHLTKPVNPQQLYRALEKWIKVGMRAPNMPEEASEDAFILSVPNLSIQQGLLHVNGNKGLYTSLLQKFPAQYKNDCQKIRELLAVGDNKEAERVAHTVKSVSGTLGMTELFTSSQMLESVLKRDEDPEESLEKFTAQLKEMVEALEKVFASERKESQSEASKPLPEGREKERLKYEIESLNRLVREDLMEAWEKVTRMEAIFLCTACAEEFSVLTVAVRDCDYEKVAKQGQVLLRCLA